MPISTAEEQKIIFQCCICGNPTEWDTGLGAEPLCQECWDSRAGIDNEMAAKHRAYREAHKEELAAKHRAYREAHKEELAAKHRAYYQAHKEELAAKQLKLRRN